MFPDGLGRKIKGFFTAPIKANVPSAALPSTGNLLDLQVNSVTVHAIRKDGRIVLANGSWNPVDPGIFGALAPTTGVTIDHGTGNPTIRVFRNGATMMSITNQIRMTSICVALNTDTANSVARFWGPSIGLVELDSGTTGAYRDLKLRSQITTGSISTGVTAVKTASFTVSVDDGLIPIDSTSGDITVTLETAVGHNRIHAFKKVAGGNAVTIDGDASETIDGSLSITLTDRAILQSDGANWKQIA